MEENKKEIQSERGNNKKLIKVIVIVAVIFSLLTVSTIVAVGYLIYSMNITKDEVQKKYIDDVYTDNSSNNINDIKDESVNNKKNIQIAETDKSNIQTKTTKSENAVVISSEQIKWKQTPENVGDLGYFKNIQDECNEKSTYYYVGDVVSGEYAGYKIYTVDGAGCGMMGDFPFRMLLKGDNAIFFKGYDRFEKWEVDVLKNNIGGESDNRIINGNIIVDDLVFKNEMQHGNIKLIDREYTNNMFYPQSYEILKKAFETEQGTVWMTDRKSADTIFASKKNKSENDYKVYDTFNSNAFFLRASDGTAISYKLQFDFISDQDLISVYLDNDHNSVEKKLPQQFKLPIVWNGGEKNNKEYELYPIGCGTIYFAYDFTNKISIDNDLKVIGKIGNKNIYGYKDTTHPEFKKLYKDIYWAQDGKKSEEEFLKMNPQIFWVDSIGRTVSFYLTDIISPAECGKPVIYLYPEKEINVHVQVSPKSGFSMTEPDYGKNGWYVKSTPNSVITNLANGKEYPYLFWEGNSNELLPQDGKGFVVDRNSLNKFFNKRLAELGLSLKEASDFKEFWIPKMLEKNKKYYFVRFLPSVFINKSAPLNITPKPDTVIRVLMDYQGLDGYKSVKQQRLSAPERKGFTVVEWGGILK